MDTKSLNFIDKIIAYLRLIKVVKYVDKNDLVLDLGCGIQGYFLKFIKEKIKEGYGIDYDLNHNYSFENIKFIKKNILEKLPIKTNSVDKIFLLAVIEHIENDKVEKLLDRLYLLLKNNGKVVITTPTLKAKRVLENFAKLNIVNKKEIMDHKKYYNYLDFKKLAKNTGFKIIKYSVFQFGLNSICILSK